MDDTDKKWKAYGKHRSMVAEAASSCFEEIMDSDSNEEQVIIVTPKANIHINVIVKETQ